MTNISLKDLLGECTKEELIDFCKVHGMKGYSRLKKAELAEKLAEHMLQREIWEKYLLFLTKEELEKLKNAACEEINVYEDDALLWEYLFDGGYCNIAEDGELLLPGECQALLKEGESEGFDKKREKISEIRIYVQGTASLYGVVSIERAAELYNRDHEEKLTEADWMEFADYVKNVTGEFILVDDYAVDKKLYEDDLYKDLLKLQETKIFYKPSAEEIREIASASMESCLNKMAPFYTYLKEQNILPENEAELLCLEILDEFHLGYQAEHILDALSQSENVNVSDEQKEEMKPILEDIWKKVRSVLFCGYKPEEIVLETEPQAVSASQNAEAAGLDPKEYTTTGYEAKTIVRTAEKVYPNDPCPCGSGKKYKKCCGKK